jgi:CRP-like cAMP-binding protein
VGLWPGAAPPLERGAARGLRHPRPDEGGGSVAEIEEMAPPSTKSAGFDSRDLDEMRRIGHEVSFGPGEANFESGDRADAVFMVLEGEAQVDVGGRFHRLRPGDVFGEMAVLAPDRRMATVRAVGSVRALSVESDTFLSLLVDHCELGVSLLRTLVLRLREVEQRIDAWMAP